MDGTSMYENISDEENGSFDQPDADAAVKVDNNNNPRGDTYAERAARGVEMDNSTSEQHEPRLSNFERENFHPRNVTPGRPCTAYFLAGQLSTLSLSSTF